MASKTTIFLALLTILMLGVDASAQTKDFDPYTDELSSMLEKDAISAMARHDYIDAVQLVCKRTAATESNDLNTQAAAWMKRNGKFVDSATAAIDEIGNRYFADGGARSRQRYFDRVFYTVQKAVKQEVEAYFNGSSLSNFIAPLPGQCSKEAKRIAQGHVEFVETPEDVMFLRKYMQKKEGKK